MIFQTQMRDIERLLDAYRVVVGAAFANVRGFPDDVAAQIRDGVLTYEREFKTQRCMLLLELHPIDKEGPYVDVMLKTHRVIKREDYRPEALLRLRGRVNEDGFVTWTSHIERQGSTQTSQVRRLVNRFRAIARMKDLPTEEIGASEQVHLLLCYCLHGPGSII